ncbi:hypothetical protein DEU56DRAFT_918947 [Suillus clintonianus]|uniref:uncharacterized protein n=1 Tax=Suillus clintonianus TaxID=1904413 RepID=UPI001B862B8E|nr:uncharacterized protein DEU56DRAFT_918947 [Suillus clintonianus]KAG2117746.1 hypothetical protein DEU56DRAFT_918947 [Suillus clintonianus]
MDTSDSAKKRPISPSHEDTSEGRKISAKRPKVKAPGAEPRHEVPGAEPMFPLPPFRQTPGPISVSQSYLRRLILERWEAEVKACEKAKQLQLLEIAPGPALTLMQASLRRIVIDRWDAELKRCEEAKRVQLLELLLGAHGISRLV